MVPSNSKRRLLTQHIQEFLQVTPGPFPVSEHLICKFPREACPQTPLGFGITHPHTTKCPYQSKIAVSSPVHAWYPTSSVYPVNKTSIMDLQLPQVSSHMKNVVLLTLESDDLPDVQDELTPAAAKWKSIGIALRLNPDTLESIQAEKSGDLAACLESMVTDWLEKNYNWGKFGPPSWQMLDKAVSHPAGGAYMALAEKIAKTHKAGGMSSRYIL